MVNTHQNTPVRKLNFRSPPKRITNQPKASEEVFDFVTLSDAKPKSGPGLSTLQKVGLTLGLTVAVGGAFVAGAHFSEQANQETDLEVELGREVNDFKTDWKRGVEDFKTGWKRGFEDAKEGEPSEERQLERDLEDLQRDIKRESQDAGKKIKRTFQDLFRD